ncbi:MAG: hypothetical protein J6I96_06725 [Oscillospiraceae bacterium]|nr:hypothetical protein [Oscillospiraceae bacterium]
MTDKERYALFEYIYLHIDPSDRNRAAYTARNNDVTDEICYESQNIVYFACDRRYHDVLEINSGVGCFTEKLSELCDNVFAAESDEDLLRLNRLRNGDKAVYLNKADMTRKYDLVFADMTCDERDIGDVLDELIPLLRDDAKLFVLTGADDAQLLRVKHDIRVYYPYPSVKRDLLYVFSDNRLPTESELFFCPETCKSGRYEDLMKDHSFCDVRAVELYTKKQDICDYCKFSVMRREDMRIITGIYRQDEIYITKTPLEKSVGHTEHMVLSFERLSKVFEGSFIDVNRMTAASPVTFEYVRGTELFDLITGHIRSGEVQTAKELIYRFASVLRSRAAYRFVPSEGFSAIFGDYDDDAYSLEYTDIDMCFDNIIVHDGIWTVTDYEFCFDFTIPVDFVIFRAVFYLFQKAEKLPGRATLKKEIYEHLGISGRVSAFYDLELRFQRYIEGDVRFQRRTAVISGRGTGYRQALKRLRTAYKT